MKNKTVIAAIVISLVSLCCSAVCLCVEINANSGNTASDSPNIEAVSGEMQYVMYIGTNDKDTYQLEMTAEEAKNIVDEVCLKYFEGYTLQEAIGAWTDEKKNI